MPRLIGSLQHRPNGWWIVGMADACFVEHGPYGRREEAQEDLAGLRRIWYDNQKYWAGLGPVLDVKPTSSYNIEEQASKPDLENQDGNSV